MTPEQTSAFFDAGESFVEGTIAAVMVVFWLLVVAMQLARPYMVRNLRKFTLRLGADLWWIIYVGLRDILIVTLFLGGFIFFYPDVVAGKDLPVTGGLATVCAFAVLVLKLVSKGEADVRSFKLQTALLGLGATLYIVPYVIGVQITAVGGDTADQLAWQTENLLKEQGDKVPSDDRQKIEDALKRLKDALAGAICARDDLPQPGVVDLTSYLPFLSVAG